MGSAFATAVYLLCFATSGACAVLLGRHYRRTGAKLLFWSTGCFTLLAANNLAVIVDIVMLPARDFSLLRLALSLAAVCLILFGFIWSLEEDE